jgi:hypothetical protein
MRRHRNFRVAYVFDGANSELKPVTGRVYELLLKSPRYDQPPPASRLKEALGTRDRRLPLDSLRCPTH